MNYQIQLTKFRTAAVFTCMLLLLVYPADAQKALTLKGRLLDAVTREPLPFATISVPQSMTGVISNQFGEFQYHIPEGFESSMVQITFTGYAPIKIQVSEIKSDVL